MLYQLYNGAAWLLFDEQRHIYSVDGETVPSVTSIAAPKPALVSWAAKTAAEHIGRRLVPGVALDEDAIATLVNEARTAHIQVAAEAAAIGTAAHAAAEAFARTGRVECPEDEAARRSFEQFLAWWSGHAIEVHAVEAKVYSRRYGYAGTADLFASIDGINTVVDFKTGSAIYADHAMQLAAYAAARNEERPGRAYRHGLVLRLPKDGAGFEVVTAGEDELEAAFDAFLGLLAYHQWSRSPGRKPSSRELVLIQRPSTEAA